MKARKRTASADGHVDLTVSRRTMNGKPVFEITIKSVINFNSGFGHKALCNFLTFSLATSCAYSCWYCYVLNLVRRHPEVQRILKLIEKEGLEFRDVVMIRIDALDILMEQLTTRKPRRIDLEARHIIYTSPLVDAAANLPLAEQTIEACLIILEFTKWTIRILSKSQLLPYIAQNIPDRYRDRMIYGVSTGTLDDKLAGSFEVGTAPVSKRIESLHWLQDHDYRTFAMFCPSLPQNDYDGMAQNLAHVLRVDRCEHVWAEVLNGRDDALPATATALEMGGFQVEAERLRGVGGAGNQVAWEGYARATFLAHAKYVQESKLRFLQYVSGKTRDWWIARRPQGAVPLGNAVEEKYR